MWEMLSSKLDGDSLSSGAGRLAGLVLTLAVLAPVSADARGRVDVSDEAFERAGAPPLSAPGAYELLSLDFAPEERRTVVGLTATGPLLNHTAWQERRDGEEIVVVELPGVDARDLQPLAEVGTPQVRLVRTIAQELSGRPSTRLEIVRLPGARHEVSIDPKNPNRLLVTLPSADAGARELGAATAVVEPARVLASRAEPAPGPVRSARVETPSPKAAARTDVARSDAARSDAGRSDAARWSSARGESTAAVAAEPHGSRAAAAGTRSARPAEAASRRADGAPLPTLAPVSSERPATGSRPASVVPTGLRSAAEAAGEVVRIRDAQVRVGDDGRTLLELVGTGPVRADAPFALDDPPRLVIDLPGAVWEVSRGVIPIRQDGIHRVRIRQNQPLPDPVTRVVFDLESASTTHQLIQGPDSLVVALGGGRSRGLLPAAALMTASAAAPGPSAGQSTDLQALAQLGRPGGFAGAMPPARPTGAMLPPTQEMRESAVTSGALTLQPLSGAGDTGRKFETVQFGTEEPAFSGDPISVSLKDADLQDLFRMFKQISGINIIVDSDLKGQTITIEVTDVPWDQVMAIVMKANSLGSTLEGNVLRIAPLTKLAREEQQKKALQDARELAGDVVSIARTLSYATGSDAEQLVRRSLSARGTAQLDRRTNTLIIKDIVPRVREIENLLDLIDQPTKQVMIEARIVETTKDFTKSVGITWGLAYIADRAFGNSTNFSFPRSWAADYAVNLPVSAATSTLGLSFRNILNTFALDLAISAAEQRGRARIISAPRIMVQNNEDAEIESGVQIPIVNTTATEIEVTFVSASLKLSVKPQITADDTIIMNVDLENNQPVFIQSVGDNASIATRRATTVVAVPDGGTTVIGGIYQVNEGVSQDRVPFLSRIPLLGWLFRNKTIDRTNDELIIFLTPSIQKN